MPCLLKLHEPSRYGAQHGTQDEVDTFRDARRFLEGAIKMTHQI